MAKRLSADDQMAPSVLGDGKPRWLAAAAPLLCLVSGCVLGPIAASPSLGVHVGIEALIRMIESRGGMLALFASLGIGAISFRTARWLGWLRDKQQGNTEQPMSLSLHVGIGLALLVVLVLAGGAMGVFGAAFGGSVGKVIAWTLLLAGFAGAFMLPRTLLINAWWSLAATRSDGGERVLDGVARVVLGAAWCAAGVWIAFATSMPGLLWPSEFGGYDSLSYHLPLAVEWLASGRMWPTTNNVYSFLPSGFEALFAWQGMLLPGNDLLANGGRGVIAAQQLHAAVGIAAAGATGALARRVAFACNASHERARLAGASAMLVVLLTPWAFVVGTLSYNEMGLVFLLAACGTAMMTLREKPVLLAAVLAVLVGGACAIKPTALLMVGVPVGVWMLLAITPRKLPVSVLVGVVVGCGMLSPWMVRNYAASGNPVFPFAAGVFAREDGSMGHWNAEQVARCKAGHTFQGSLVDRAKLLVMPDPSDPMGSTHRGLRHPQWGEGLLLALLASALTLKFAFGTRAREGAADVREGALSRRHVMAIAIMLPMQIVLWFATTHVQSRFLLACVMPAAVLIALVVSGVVRVRSDKVRSMLQLRTRAIALLLLVVLAMWYRAPRAMVREGMPVAQGIAISLEEWLPKAALAADGKSFVAEPLRAEVAVAALPSGSRVALIGDATPLYFATPRVGFDRVSYATTWDTNPVVDAGGLSRLADKGFSHALLNFAELDRLQRSGFLDPRIKVRELLQEAQAGQRPIAMWGRGSVVLVPLRAAGATPK